MKRRILTALQLALLLATLAIAGSAVAPQEAEASECALRCQGGPYQCGFQADCWWSCT